MNQYVRFLLFIQLLMLPPAFLKAAPDAAFSTYFGGSGHDQPAGDMFVDAAGYIYIAGPTKSADFPVTPGAFDTTFNDRSGNSDAFVMKLDPQGKRVWSTLIGTPTRDVIYAIKVDAAGYVYIAGAFGDGAPVTPGVIQQKFAGMDNKGAHPHGDGYLAKLKPDGSGFVWATYLGTAASESLRSMDVDGDGNPVVVSHYQGHAWPADWFRSGYRSEPGGGKDNVVIKVSRDGRRVLWASYLGGSADESRAPNVRLGPDGKVNILTSTHSDDMPTTAGVHDRSYNGGEDLYLATLSPDGKQLLMGSYLGTGEDDGAGGKRGIAVDSNGELVLSGWTRSPSFPLSDTACRSEPMGWTPWGVTGITARFSPAGKLLASTYIGDSEGLSLDSRGNVYVGQAVWGDVVPVSDNAFQSGRRGGSDGALVVMSRNLDRVLYATYLGGKGDDNARITAVGPDDSFYVAGETASKDFPLRNPLQGTYAGGGDSYVVKFSPLD